MIYCCNGIYFDFFPNVSFSRLEIWLNQSYGRSQTVQDIAELAYEILVLNAYLRKKSSAESAQTHSLVRTLPVHTYK